MIVKEWLRRIDGASVDVRIEAVAGLAEAWLGADLDAVDRDDVEAALTLVLDDASSRVRMALAEALARSPLAPRYIMLALAADQPAIARLVLRRSPVLSEAELVDIIAVSEPPYQCAIASRSRVTAGLAAAIAEVAAAEPCAVLADNPGADLRPGALARMAERHGDNGRLREVLLARPDLPMPVRQMLIARLGSVLGALAISRFSLGSERADRCVREACDKATVTLAAEAGDGDMAPLVAHLSERGQLTTSLLLRALCAGNVRFLEAALAHLSGMPRTRVRSLLAEGRASALRALFARAGLPKLTFGAFVVAIAVFRDMAAEGHVVESGALDAPHLSRRMIERVLERYEDFAPEEADKLIVMLRRLASEAARDAARERLERAREDLRLEASVSGYIEDALKAA